MNAKFVEFIGKPKNTLQADGPIDRAEINNTWIIAEDIMAAETLTEKKPESVSIYIHGLTDPLRQIRYNVISD